MRNDGGLGLKREIKQEVEYNNCGEITTSTRRMSDGTAIEVSSSQSSIIHSRSLSKIIPNTTGGGGGQQVVTQLTTISTAVPDPSDPDVIISNNSRGGRDDGTNGTEPPTTQQLLSSGEIHSQQHESLHHCIVSSNPAVVTVSTSNNSDGNHLSVHRVIRSSAGTEDGEQGIEECCVGGGEEEETEIITDGTGEGILAAVVTKHRHQLPQGISVTGVSLAEIHQSQQEHEELMGVEDPLQHHHHVQHHQGTLSVNMAHHHHHDEQPTAANTIITIPVVGSLTPYTVIGDAEANGNAIAVSLAQETLPIQHHSHIQQSGHTLIQHPHTSTLTTTAHPETHCNSHLTWEEAVSAPVLPIRCKDTNAELHKAKFGSGNKGKCIKSGSDWFTPTEFEALCGRGNSKDWKRSIRFGGRTLQTLIDKGFLIPHASSCICSNCVDDATATGPIRPFTPYQRKRKSQSADHSKGTKLERLTSKDSNTDESSDIGTPATPLGMSATLNPLTQALMKINQITLPPCTQDAWKVVEDAVSSIVTAAAAVKSLVQEMKERTNQEVESLRSQLQNTVQTTLVQNQIVGQPQILRIFDSNRIQTYSIEVLDPESFKPIASNATGISKCENCGRDGSLECSGCHHVHYCSSFCQKKDWPNHQAICSDRSQPECKTEPHLS